MKTTTKPTAETRLDTAAVAVPGECIATSRFGVLEIDPSLVIHFRSGMIGFEHSRRYAVLQIDPDSPFRWLQSLDDGALAFPVVDPWMFKPDYAPVLSAADAEDLELAEETPRFVLAVVTIPRENPQAMTANLLGPVVVNAETRQAKQVVLQDDCYTTRHEIVTSMLLANREAA